MDTPPLALIAVYDKTGVVELAAGLVELGFQIIASAGTAEVLGAAGVPVVDVADYTGSPVMLGHRVVTLHPRIHGGILADRDDPDHQDDLEANGIDPIDLVVVNLYPFEASPGVETIDIGGPAMVRAAAKNHAHVAVVVDPADYRAILDELRARASLAAPTRLRLARKAFRRSAAYEAAIAGWFDGPSAQPEAGPDGVSSAVSAGAGVEPEAGPGGAESGLSAVIGLELERAEVLRYGENPHQHGARYRRRGSPGFFDGVVRRSGPALSYLNVMDADAAWHLAQSLGDSPAAVIVKHANPCGAAVAPELVAAYSRAFDCDPRSAFGGVVATNTVIDASTAEAMAASAQADVVIAPGYDEGVIERLAARRANTRLLEAPTGRTAAGEPRWELRSVGRSGDDFLVQTPGRLVADPAVWRVVTAREPTEAEHADAVFAWRVCARTSSNAVVLARGGVAWGIGAGQQNRVEAVQLASAKAAGRAAGGACASDGFFPFPDGVEAAADAGSAVIVQPGGSVNDAAVIAAADERNLAMLFTGERQFHH